MRRGVFTVTILLLAASCARTQPTQSPTPLVEPSDEAVMEAGEIIFDGDGCAYQGLPELPPGVYSFVLKDLSDLEVDFALEKYTQGKTWQDYLDYVGEGDVYVTEPDWVDIPPSRGSAKPRPDGGEIHTYILKIEGTYGLVTWTWNPFHIWPCGPLQVIEPSSD